MRISRGCLSFIAFGCFFGLHGQSFHLAKGVIEAQAKASAWVQLNGSAEIGSNSLRNDLLLGLTRAEFITREVRIDNLNAIGRTGRVGQASSVSLQVTCGDSLFGRPHWRSQWTAGASSVLGVEFNDALFEMTFFGNKPFENTTVDLGPARFEQQVYQKIGWGIVDSRTLSALRFSLVKGQRLQDVDIEQANVFTATDGRLIDASIQGTYQRSDTSDNSFSAFNGLGAALDFQLNRKIALINSGWISIQVQDLGVTVWNENTILSEQDSSVSFDGIGVANIFDLDNVLIGEDAILDTLGIATEKSRIVKALPFLVSVSVSDQLTEHFSLEAKVQYRFITGYRPRASVQGNYWFNENTRAGIEVAYGGFNDLRAGLSFDVLFGNSVIIGITVPNLPGPLSDQSSGAEGMLNVTALF